MRLIITQRPVGEWAADFIAARMKNFSPSAEQPFVLGLPTGGTPKGMYRALVEKYQKKEISFRHTISFNMDEYIGLSQAHPESYHAYMSSIFFDHIDILHENTHIPDGNAVDLVAECVAYEAAILDAGGINLFVGGVGEDGHIAFNEPGSSLTSRTRVKTLTESTIKANAVFFENNMDAVPRTALTVGIGTIMDADEVLILVSGAAKAQALGAAVEGGVSHMCPISVLQMHPKAVIVADEAAVQELKVTTVNYFNSINDEYSRFG